MTTPVLIDTDADIDDAVGLGLALACGALSVKSVVSVGGRVSAEEAADTIGRLLCALAPPRMPGIGIGRPLKRHRPAARHAEFGADRLCGEDLPAGTVAPQPFADVYGETIAADAGSIVVVALGPLTNLADILRTSPGLLAKVQQIFVAGGAAWAKGDVTDRCEFNFACDPEATASILSSGLPITICPLDVARFVQLDESHVAHLAASGYRTGEVLAKLLSHALARDAPPGVGRTFVHAALTVGAVIWPQLFLKTRMRFDVVTDGPDAGQVKPALGGDAEQRVDLLTAVNASDFVENLLESLCHEAFVV
jgi:inosine-uridine nucleoside N-ribohydrolase